MKRAMENEEYDNPRSKRFRLAEGSEDLPLPTEIEAQSYLISDLISVKEHFKNDRAKYAEFIQILNDFRSKTCDTIAVITKLKQLFKSHELLLSFNKFLPKGFEILFPFKEFLRKEKKVEFGDAMRYIKKIKTSFENEDNILKGFFDIMNAYMKGNYKMINGIHTEVKLLFGDHQDLVDEFAYFLPASASSFLVPHFQAGTDSHKQDTGKGQKCLTLDNNCHQSSEFAVEKDVEGTPDVVNECSKKGEKEKQCEEEDSNEYNRPAQNMKSEIYVIAQDSNKRNSTSSSGDMYVRKRPMSPTEDSTGQHSQQGAPTEPSKTLSGNNPQLLDFFEKVKANIGNVAYREIVKCISMYNAKIINAEHLQHLAVCILGKCPEAVDNLNEMISQSSIARDCLDLEEEEYRKHYKTGKGEVKERNSDGALEKENERMKGTDREENQENERRGEKDRDRHKDQHDQSRVVGIQNEEKKGKDNEEESGGHKDQNHKSRDVMDGNASTVPNNDKITYDSISEMDLSKWEKCTSSYRLLPQNLVKPIASCSSSVAAEVLNDICLSVPSATEDYRKQKHVNRYEEAIFKCEDDRYEMDILIETSKAAIKRICEVLEKKNEETSQINAHFRIEDHLTDMDLRCVERIYGDCGLLIIDLLREKPNHCLPVIVKRLQQKRDEWINCRNTYNIGWADVYSKNYQRSLDHITFSCKQRDKNRTRTHLDL